MTQGLSVKTTANFGDVTRALERMLAHFEATPNDDPVKVAMIELGGIDAERHLPMVSDCADGVIAVRVTPSPELQRIMDMVP